MSKPSPCKYFKPSPEIIRLAVMMYVRFPLSLRNVADLLREQSVVMSQENCTVLVASFSADVRCVDPRTIVEGSSSTEGRAKNKFLCATMR